MRILQSAYSSSIPPQLKKKKRFQLFQCFQAGGSGIVVVDAPQYGLLRLVDFYMLHQQNPCFVNHKPTEHFVFVSAYNQVKGNRFSRYILKLDRLSHIKQPCVLTCSEPKWFLFLSSVSENISLHLVSPTRCWHWRRTGPTHCEDSSISPFPKLLVYFIYFQIIIFSLCFVSSNLEKSSHFLFSLNVLSTLCIKWILTGSQKCIFLIGEGLSQGSN